MKKKQRLSLGDLSRIPVTPVKTTSGYESSKDLWARLKREEREAALKAEREAFLNSPEGQLALSAGELNAALIACWSRPSETITDDDAVADSPVLGGYTMRPSSITDKLVDFTEELNQTYEQFCRGLDEKRGKTALNSPAAVKTLVAFMICNVYRGGIAVTVENWVRSFERLIELGILDGGAPQPVDQASPTRSIADQIEFASDDEARELVGTQWSKELQQWFFHWLDTNMCHPEVWNIDRSVMTSPRITKFIGEVLDRHPELNPFHHETWNFVRRALDFSCLLGHRGRYLTNDERTSQSVEAMPTNLSFEQKQDFNRRLSGLK